MTLANVSFKKEITLGQAISAIFILVGLAVMWGKISENITLTQSAFAKHSEDQKAELAQRRFEFESTFARKDVLAGSLDGIRGDISDIKDMMAIYVQGSVGVTHRKNKAKPEQTEKNK